MEVLARIAFLTGAIICLYSASDSVKAVNGYTTDFIIFDCETYHAKSCLSCPTSGKIILLGGNGGQST